MLPALAQVRAQLPHYFPVDDQNSGAAICRAICATQTIDKKGLHAVIFTNREYSYSSFCRWLRDSSLCGPAVWNMIRTFLNAFLPRPRRAPRAVARTLQTVVAIPAVPTAVLTTVIDEAKTEAVVAETKTEAVSAETKTEAAVVSTEAKTETKSEAVSAEVKTEAVVVSAEAKTETKTESVVVSAEVKTETKTEAVVVSAEVKTEAVVLSTEATEAIVTEVKTESVVVSTEVTQTKTDVKETKIQQVNKRSIFGQEFHNLG
jgi:hypothetical protein